MATLVQRATDLEYLLAHLPEHLDARFAGVHTKLAEMRETLAIHTHRLGVMDSRLTQVGLRLDRIETTFGQRLDRVEKSLADIAKLLDERLPKS